MFVYTKSSEVNPPEKQTYENNANFFSPMGQYSEKSQKRKALASVEFRVGGKKKKCGIVYPFVALKLWDQMLQPYKPAERCNNQSTNSRERRRRRRRRKKH